MRILMYEIWSEGYAATGESSGAAYHGTAEGKTFRQACADHFLGKHRIPGVGESTYSEKSNTLWGCKLYDNEHDARRTFG